jgi:hypothetical protein
MKRFLWSVLGSAIVLISYGAGAQSTSEFVDIPPNYDTLALERAGVLKTWADELFIDDPYSDLTGEKLKAVRQLYQQAHEAACDADPQQFSTPAGKDAARATRELLRADIRYRTLLLQAQLPFWGATYARSIFIPGQENTLFNHYIEDYKQVQKEVTTRLKAIDAAGKDELDESANQVRADGQAVANQVKMEQQDVHGISDATSQQETLQRIRTIDASIASLAVEAQKAETKLHAAQSSVSANLTSALGASLGIPPNITSAAASGNLQNTIVAVVTSDAVVQSPAIADAVKSVQQAAPDTWQAVSKIRELNDEFQKDRRLVTQYRSAAEYVGEAIRTGSIDRIARAGQELCSLNNSDIQNRCRQLESQVAAAKPVQNAVDFVRRAAAQGAAIQKTGFALQSQLTDALIAKTGALDSQLDRLGSFADQAVTRLAQNRAELLANWTKLYSDSARAAQLTGNAGRALLDGYARSASHDLVDWLNMTNPGARDALMRTAGFTSSDQLEAALHHRGLAAISNWVRIDDQGVLQLNDAQNTALGPLKVLFARATQVTNVDAQDAQAAIQTAVQNGQDQINAARAIVLRYMDAPTFVRIASDASSKLTPADQANLWTQSVGQLTATARHSVVQSIAETEVGAAAQAQVSVPQIAAQLPPAPPEPPPAQDSDAGDQQQQMAIAALSAAYPVAGTAAKIVVGALAAMEQMGRLKELNNERSTLSQEQAQLSMVFKQVTLDQALAQQERRMASALQAAATTQSRLYAEAVSQAGQTQKGLRAEVILHRSLAFYRAERLREQYDRVSAAYALWLFDGTTSKEKIAELVRDDPQTLRYATDTDIQLYSWLSRTGESSREDLFRLTDHWEKLHDLVERVRVERGELPGPGEKLGAYGQRDFDLSRDLLTGSEDAARVKEWLANPTHDLTVSFTLKPKQERFGEYGPIKVVDSVARGATAPAEPQSAHQSPTSTSQTQKVLQLHNLRLLEVRIRGLYQQANGAPQERTVDATLSHPGYAWVARAGGTGREPWLFQLERRWPTGAVPGLSADPMTVTSVKAYLSSTNYGGPFIGYSPYTTWSLTLRAMSRAIQPPKSIGLSFAYVSLDSTQPRTEGEFLKQFGYDIASYAVRASNANADTALSAGATLSTFPVKWYQTSLVADGQPAVPMSEQAIIDLLGTAPTGSDASLVDDDQCKDEPRPAGVVASGPPEPQRWRVAVSCRAQSEIQADLIATLEQQPRRSSGEAPNQEAHARALTTTGEWMTRLRAASVCDWDKQGRAKGALAVAPPGAWLFGLNQRVSQ